MQLKLIFLLACLTGLSCQGKIKKACNDKQAQYLGLQHSSSGTSNQIDALNNRCQDKNENFKSLYTKAYQEGLNSFCTEARGQSQAQFGLEQETICKDSVLYEQGFQKELTFACTSQKAYLDVLENLNTTNPLCKSISSYKVRYFKELNKHCSFHKGRQIGYSKKSTLNLCVDSKRLPSFLRGHKRGLSDIHAQENRSISKKLWRKRKERRSLKKKLTKPLEGKEKIDLNLNLNRTESEILELQSQYEANKKFILR